jgi:hypothetical protein
MVANSFFRLKITCYSPYSSAFINVKPDSPDFIGTSRWDGCNIPMVAQPLRELPELEQWTTDFWQFAQKTR